MLPVFVINLDRSLERWERSTRQLNALDIPHVRLPAVDGDSLSDEDVEKVSGRKPLLYRWLRDLSRSEIGCLLSHRAAWQKIIDGGHAGGFVFEDDFLAFPDLQLVMTEISGLNFDGAPVLVQMYQPNEWDGWYYASRKTNQLDICADWNLELRIPPLWGTVAYYITRDGAVSLAKKTKRFYRPLDDIVRRSWESGLTVLNCKPSPVRHDDVPSLIGPGRQIVRAAIANPDLYRQLFDREFAIITRLYQPVNEMRARRVIVRAKF